MLFYTLLYGVFVSVVYLISSDVTVLLPIDGNARPAVAAKQVFYKSNCLNNKWNPITTIECQLGVRGPCDEGQVFSAVPDAPSYEWMDISMKSCPSTIPDGCQHVEEDPSEEEEPLETVKFRHGVCLWTDENHPCRGFPAGYRFHSWKKQCFLTDDFLSTGCANGQVFASVNRTHGQCRCRYHDDVIWPVDGKCYKRHTQGPCGAKEWLIYNRQRQLTCELTSCPLDGEHAEWKVNGRTLCYRLNEQGPCPQGKYFIRGEFEVKCDDYDSEDVRRSLLRAPMPECEAGKVRDKMGRCRRVFTGK